MKKLTKILVAALALALLVCAFAFVASAETETTYEHPFEIAGEFYDTWAEAYAAAREGDTIVLRQDYTFTSADLTDGINYFNPTLPPEIKTAADGSDYFSGNFTTMSFSPTTVAGVKIDKAITLNLGGNTLSYSAATATANAEEKVAGVLFYVDTAELKFTIEGEGKLSSDIPALVVSFGDVTVNGGAKGMEIEYTGTKLVSHIQVGNISYKNNDSSNSDKGAAENGDTAKASALTLTGTITFDATSNALAAGTASLTNANGEEVPTEYSYGINNKPGWTMNVNWYSSIGVGVCQTLNIVDAKITNASAAGEARSFVTLNPVQSYYDSQTYLNVSDSEIYQELAAPVVAMGNAQGSNEGYNRRGVITVDDSRIEATTLSASATGVAMFNSGRVTSSQGAMELVVNNSEIVASAGGNILGNGATSATTYGLWGAALFTDSYVYTTASGNWINGGFTAIYDNCYLATGDNGFASCVTWVSTKDTTYYDTAVSSINATRFGSMTYVDALGGFGVLVKAGCAFSKSYPDYTSVEGAVPGMACSTWRRSYAMESGSAQYSAPYKVNDTYKSAYVVGSDVNYRNVVAASDLSKLEGTTLGVAPTSNLSVQTVGGVQLIISGRQGNYTVYTDAEGNTYFSYRLDNSNITYTWEPYVHVGGGDSITTDGFGTAALSNTSFYSFDWDMMSGTGTYDKITDGYYLQPQVAVYAEGETSSYVVRSGAPAYLRVDSNGNPYWLNGSTATATFDSTAGVWHHFTYVMELNYTTSTDDAGATVYDYSSSLAYIYCDGELLGTLPALPTTVVDAIKTHGPDQASLLYWWLIFDTGASGNDEAFFDNLVAARYSVGFDGTADDIAGLATSQRYEAPFGLTKLTVDGVNYDTVEDGVAHIMYDSTVSLSADLAGLEVNKPLVVNTNGNAFTYTVGNGSILVDELTDEAGNAVYTFRWATAADKMFEVTVNGETVQYPTWADAYAAVPDGGTVKLVSNYNFKATDLNTLAPESGNSQYYVDSVAQTDVSTITINKSVTIDLNGYTLSSSGLSGVVFYLTNNSYTLTVTGNGKISSDIPLVSVYRGHVVINGGAEGLTVEATGTTLDRLIKMGMERNNWGNTTQLPSLTVTGKVNFHTTGATTLDTTDTASNTELKYAFISHSYDTEVKFENAEVTVTAADGASARVLAVYAIQEPWQNRTASVDVIDSTITNEQNSAVFAAGVRQNLYWVRRVIYTVTDSTINNNSATGTWHAMFKTGMRVATQSAAEIFVNNSTLSAESGWVISGGTRTTDWSAFEHTVATVSSGSVLKASTTDGAVFAYGVTAIVEGGAYLEGKHIGYYTVPWIDFDADGDDAADAAFTSAIEWYKNTVNGGANSAGLTSGLATYVDGSLGSYIPETTNYREAMIWGGPYYGGFGVKLGEGVYLNSNYTPTGTAGAVSGTGHNFTMPEGLGYTAETIEVGGESVVAYRISDLSFAYDLLLNADFQDVTLENDGTLTVYKDETAGFTVDGLGFAIDKNDGMYVGRTGEYHVYLADDGKSVSLMHAPYMSDKTAKDQPYVYVNTGAQYYVDGASALYAEQTIGKYSYYSIDFDLATATGVYGGFNVTACFRVLDGTSLFFNVPIYLESDGGYAYWQQGGVASGTASAGEKFAVEAGDWHHYTYVVAVDTANNYAVTTYLYMDGVLYGKYDIDEATLQTDIASNGETSVALTNFRLHFDTTTADTPSDARVNLDNIAAARYPLSFTAGGLTAADEVAAYISTIIYGEGYELPYGVTKAVVDDVPYDALDAAYAAIGEGSVVTLKTNWSGFVPKCPVTVNAGTYVFDYTAVAEYYCDRNGTTYVFVVATEEHTYTVTWVYPDGTTATTTVVHGKDAVPLTYDTTVEGSNGWLKFSYAGWSKTKNGAPTDDFTVYGSVTYYAAVSTARAYLSDAMYNLTLYGNVQVNLFVPDSGIPDGVRLIGVYSDEACTDASKVTPARTGVSAKDRTYSEYAAGKIDAHLIDTQSVKLYVKFTFGGTEYVQTITMSPFNYCKNIIERGAVEGNDGITVVADLVRYSAVLYRAVERGTYNTDLEALLTTCVESGYCSTGDMAMSKNSDGYYAYDLSAYGDTSSGFATLQTALTAASGADMSALADYIYSANYFIPVNATGEPAFIFTMESGVKVTAVTITMNGWLPEDNGSYNYGYLTYGLDESRTEYDANGYITKAYTQSMPIYNIAETLTVNVTVESDNGYTETVSGTYDVEAYFGGMTIDGSNYTWNGFFRYASYYYALRSFADSAVAYRYGEKIEMETVVYTYADYGAKGDGVTDDFNAIRATHEAANAFAYANPDKKVVVQATAGATYYIGIGNEHAEGKAAYVNTDVDWTGASFVIDDSKISPTFDGDSMLSDGDSDGVTDSHYHLFHTPLFVVTDFAANMQNGATIYSAQTFTDSIFGGETKALRNGVTVIAPASLDNEATNVGFAPGYAALVKIRDNSHKYYVRYGGNADVGSLQNEVILIDANGNIDPTTPVQYDFYNINYMKLWDIDLAPLTVKGGTFTSLYNQIDSYSYIKRNILVARSNVTVDGLTHTPTGYADVGSPSTGILESAQTHNVTFKNITVARPEDFYTSAGVLKGSYEINLAMTNKTTLENVYQTNFYEDADGDGAVDFNGVMGTNYEKNISLINCTMNAFDAHKGLHNAYIKGCKLEHINLIGTGDAIIEDTLIHTGSMDAAVILRSDYNSSFDGNIYFNNVTLEVANDSYVGLVRVAYFNYNTGIYYKNEYNDGDGYYEQNTTDKTSENYYATYLPNIYVNGLTVKSGGTIVNATDTTAGYYDDTNSVADSSVKVAVILGNNDNGSDSRGSNYFLHEYSERDIDVTTYGSSGKIGGTEIFGTVLGGTSVTINHPMKMMDEVTITGCNATTVVEYIYNGTSYNLSFLDDGTITVN